MPSRLDGTLTQHVACWRADIAAIRDAKGFLVAVSDTERTKEIASRLDRLSDDIQQIISMIDSGDSSHGK